jgi:hypothetical protein
MPSKVQNCIQERFGHGMPHGNIVCIDNPADDLATLTGIEKLLVGEI